MHRLREVLVVALFVAGCSSGAAHQATPSATLATSPSTAALDTAAIKQQVEVAYLRSWDVYANALRTLSIDGLEESFSGEQLVATRADIEAQMHDTRPVRVEVSHNYETDVVDSTTATVNDKYRNHSVLLDPRSGEPVEADPTNDFDETYTLRLIGGSWRVVDILRR